MMNKLQAQSALRGHEVSKSFEVVRFSFDSNGKAISRSVKENLTEKAAKELCDKLNQKVETKDLGGGSEGLVAYGACPMKQRVVGDLVAYSPRA